MASYLIHPAATNNKGDNGASSSSYGFSSLVFRDLCICPCSRSGGNKPRPFLKMFVLCPYHTGFAQAATILTDSPS